MRHLARENLDIFNALGALGGALWTASEAVVALSTDPKIFSVMLYRRLWSNFRGFTSLWEARLQLEADIVLRSAVEAAICIAANHALRDRFVELVHQDTLATLERQLKQWRREGQIDMARDHERVLEEMRTTFGGLAAKAFDWRALAEAGGAPQLYGFHKGLSAQSSHVTGLSLLKGVVGANLEGQAEQDDLLALTRNSHLMMLAGAMALGSKLHASMIAASTCEAEADALVSRLNAASKAWV